MSDAWLFFREFAKNPTSLGAVAPSSPALARSVVDAASIAPGHVVVELGAGTGPFTAEILKRHAHDVHFLAFEPSAELAQRLRERFPDLRLEERFAQDLPLVLDAWGHPTVDRVVSGLPWAIFPDELQDAILAAACDRLAEDGVFVTFQYVHSQVMPQARKFLDRLNRHFGDVSRTNITWRNVPPAFVFVCKEPRSVANV